MQAYFVSVYFIMEWRFSTNRAITLKLSAYVCAWATVLLCYCKQSYHRPVYVCVLCVCAHACVYIPDSVENGDSVKKTYGKLCGISNTAIQT